MYDMKIKVSSGKSFSFDILPEISILYGIFDSKNTSGIRD